MSMQLLYESLSQRWMPEQVVKTILEFQGSTFSPRALQQLKAALPRWAESSMSTSFAKAKDLGKQLAVAEILFGVAAPADRTDATKVREYVGVLKALLQATSMDFKADRLNRKDRKKVETIPRGHRAYNKRFRLIQRIEEKYGRWLEVSNIKELAQFSKSRLATQISESDFLQDPATACFVAYMTAKLNKRSLFTFGKQESAYDQIAELLFKRLDANSNWFAVAHVYPQPVVLEQLTDGQKGQLLGIWYSIMVRAAKILKENAETGSLDLQSLIVQRGNDSSTWNEAAGAFNKAREGWMNTLYALGGHSLLDSFAPGKTLRLMAADVAYGHRAYGDGLEPDTAVWNELPRPWDVVLGSATCNREMIETACKKYKIKGKAWVEPRPKTVAVFRPTPELVYGVVVSSPMLATTLKSLGYFAGPSKMGGSL